MSAKTFPSYAEKKLGQKSSKSWKAICILLRCCISWNLHSWHFIMYRRHEWRKSSSNRGGEKKTLNRWNCICVRRLGRETRKKWHEINCHLSQSQSPTSHADKASGMQEKTNWQRRHCGREEENVELKSVYHPAEETNAGLTPHKTFAVAVCARFFYSTIEMIILSRRWNSLGR